MSKATDRALWWALGWALVNRAVCELIWILDKAGASWHAFPCLFVLSILPVVLFLRRSRFEKTPVFVGAKIGLFLLLSAAAGWALSTQRLLALLSLPPITESDKGQTIILLVFLLLQILADALLLLAAGIRKRRE